MKRSGKVVAVILLWIAVSFIGFKLNELLVKHWAREVIEEQHP